MPNDMTGAEPAQAAQRAPGILIIKLGAFGNIVLSMAAFAAIRKHHAGAPIGVLTSAPFADWLRTFPYFDHVMVDPRPARLDLAGSRRLRSLLLSERVHPGLRLANVGTFVALPFPLSSEAPAGVVRYRLWLLAARSRSQAQSPA